MKDSKKTDELCYVRISALSRGRARADDGQTSGGYLNREYIQMDDHEKAKAEALEEALLALEEAAQALKDLKKEDITELRCVKPHELVQNVCLCVLILKGLKDVTWKGAKAMMEDCLFLPSLLEFDKDGLADKQVKQVGPLTPLSSSSRHAQPLSPSPSGQVVYERALRA